MSIAQNETLFALIGTTYGGDGVSTFALPNLQSRIPLHTGTLKGGPSYTLGESAGVESVTILTTQMPAHTHQASAVSTPVADVSTPQANLWGTSTSAYYSSGATGGDLGFLSPLALANQGGSQPHDNMQPFLVVSFIIALEGLFPSQG